MSFLVFFLLAFSPYTVRSTHWSLVKSWKSEQLIVRTGPRKVISEVCVDNYRWAETPGHRGEHGSVTPRGLVLPCSLEQVHRPPLLTGREDE